MCVCGWGVGGGEGGAGWRNEGKKGNPGENEKKTSDIF